MCVFCLNTVMQNDARGNQAGIVVQGECDINEHYLDCKIAPKEKGTHILEVTYTVADSIRKARIEVEVV